MEGDFLDNVQNQRKCENMKQKRANTAKWYLLFLLDLMMLIEILLYRINMYHYVFYIRILIFDIVMNGFCNFMSFNK